MTEESPSHKFHKALLEVLMAVGALTGAVKITEHEVQDVIKQTQAMIAEVKKPEFANGMTEKQWKELQEQQRKFLDLSRSEAFRNKLTPLQQNEIDDLSQQLPWNSLYQSHFPSSSGVAPYYVVEKPGSVKFHNPNPHQPKPQEPKPILHLDPKMPPQNVTTREVAIHEVTTRDVVTHETTTHQTTTSTAAITDAKGTDAKPTTKQIEPASDDSSKDR